MSRWAAMWVMPLLYGVCAFGAVDDAPRARLAAIETAQKAARERFHQELSAVERTEEAQKPAVDRYLAEVEKNATAALDLAREHPDDPAAFGALKFVIKTNRAGPGGATAKALRMILDQGKPRSVGQGDYLAHVALPLWQYPDAEALLRGVLTENPNRDDRAAACYWLAIHLQQQAKTLRNLKEKPEDLKDYERYKAAAPAEQLLREKDLDAIDREAISLLERAISEFGDVRLPETKRTLGESISGELFAARKLNVGQTAPEIVGIDHEGKTFRLSELRGKVVVLTFSGNWCGPCVAMYPEERELVAKYKDQPFAFVSVNTDAEVGTLRKAIDSGEITWRCWWDGGTEGPITTSWGVTGFPTIFVLDRTGVIRFKNVRGDDLARAVATLVDEMPHP